MSLTFYLASTAPYGLQAAASLIAAGFTCLGVITPPPKPIGRHQTLTPNPVHAWAEKQHLPIHFIGPKITRDLLSQLSTTDYLLVVDFGYYVPSWLIDFPRLLSVNIHPSALPRYRGASPGQAVLLAREPTSAVSIMTLAREMDAGDLLSQFSFLVDPHWTASDYYDFAFTLASQHLPTLLTDFATGTLTLTPQTGTPSFAPKINKTDAFIPWEQLTDPAQAAAIDAAIRAYTPWPHAWTLAPTTPQPKRLQLLTAHLENNHLVIDTVKLEGDTAKSWRDILNKLNC